MSSQHRLYIKDGGTHCCMTHWFVLLRSASPFLFLETQKGTAHSQDNHALKHSLSCNGFTESVILPVD